MREPGLWSKLPSLRPPSPWAASQGSEGIYWRKAKPKQENNMRILFTHVSVHSLVPSKDGYWVFDGDCTPGVIHVRLSVLCEKEAWLSGWLLVIENIISLQMEPYCCWHLLYLPSETRKRVTSGSGPHSLGVWCIPSARRPGWSSERRKCWQEIVGLRKQLSLIHIWRCRRGM